MSIGLYSDPDVARGFIQVNGSNAVEVGPQYIKVPAGTTGERPGSPTAGQMRFNSTINNIEVYTGTNWLSIIDIDVYFNSLDSNSFTYDGNGIITQIVYTSGNKQTFTYTGDTKLEVKYYDTDGTTLLATCTTNFDVNGNVSSVDWS